MPLTLHGSCHCKQVHSTSPAKASTLCYWASSMSLGGHAMLTSIPGVQVKFSVDSHAPQPFMLCYCSICRKTGQLTLLRQSPAHTQDATAYMPGPGGGTGAVINLLGQTKTLKVLTGAEHLRIYHVRLALLTVITEWACCPAHSS